MNKLPLETSEIEFMVSKYIPDKSNQNSVLKKIQSKPNFKNLEHNLLESYLENHKIYLENIRSLFKSFDENDSGRLNHVY